MNEPPRTPAPQNEPGAVSAPVLPAETTGEELARLAASQPELRTAILNHPNAYPELREWITQQEAASASRKRADKKAARVKTERRPARAKRGRGWLIGSAVFAVLALVGGSFAGGWAAANHYITSGLETSESETVRIPALDPLAGDVQMPDVRGLGEDEAMQVIADAGIPVAGVEVSERPFAGLPGIVIEQTPAFGTESPADISLVVSAPAAIPDIVGETVQEAEAQLSILGAATARLEAYDPDAAPGIVLSVAPEPGEALSDLVTLTVNGAPSAKFLSDLRQTDYGCGGTTDMLMGGSLFASSLTCSAGSSERKATWLLAGAVDRITGTVGIPDARETDATAGLRVLLDGREVHETELKWGSNEELDLRTSGALKLELVFTTEGDSTEVGLGDVKLFGTPENMSRVEGGS